ncbi:MAG: hypothetical protein NWE89_09055 [Candidatus Bathyarchaeota archaeon]|nr:hypothetical protein [Candidatus Bathyarchaeota archaeon]
MKSYVKIYGPPMMKALKTLQKIAIGMPEVCIMDTTIEAASIPTAGPSMGGPGFALDSPEEVMTFFTDVGDISEERCDTIISKSGESVGEFDFYFEWFQKPNMAQIENLINKIDEALEPIGVKYTLTTK